MIQKWEHRRIASSRFLVFMGRDGIQLGGWDDFAAAFGDRDHAIECAINLYNNADWAHVVDQNRFGPGAVIWRDGVGVEA